MKIHVSNGQRKKKRSPLKLFHTDEELKELSFKELWELLDLYLILRFTPVLTYLTKYPPFSYFWTDRFFHYENGDIRFSREKIAIVERNV